MAYVFDIPLCANKLASWSSKMVSSRNTDVAVVAVNLADQKLMQELLQSVGYLAGTFDSEAALDASDAHPQATIVCHRKTPDAPAPGLPRSHRGQRVLVFSDCTGEQEVITALEAGAHHYFNIRESRPVMLARLEAALRQHHHPWQSELVVSPFRFDLEKRRVLLHDDPVNLSPKEYEFAYYLFANRRRVVSNSELMTSVWSLPPSMDTRRIDTAACRVRKKMLLNEQTGWSLRRLRRVGYELHHFGGSD
jgi:DNA-binding response OmpR family regulator